VPAIFRDFKATQTTGGPKVVIDSIETGYRHGPGAGYGNRVPFTLPSITTTLGLNPDRLTGFQGEAIKGSFGRTGTMVVVGTNATTRRESNRYGQSEQLARLHACHREAIHILVPRN
jgi:hypothetical protein